MSYDDISFASNEEYFDFASQPGMRNWYGLHAGRLTGIATGRNEEEALAVFKALQLKSNDPTWDLELDGEIITGKGVPYKDFVDGLDADTPL